MARRLGTVLSVYARVCSYEGLSYEPGRLCFAARNFTHRTTGAKPSWNSSSARTVFIGRDHTSKWMQKVDKKSPMELINEVPPIQVKARIVACVGGTDPALGHPVEYINLDSDDPNVCKYCGLRYVQPHHHHH